MTTNAPRTNRPTKTKTPTTTALGMTIFHYPMPRISRRLAGAVTRGRKRSIRGHEGIVAKDPESKYVPGRTLRWIKVKQKNYRKEARGFYRS
jgi:hypothetical protein